MENNTKLKELQELNKKAFDAKVNEMIAELPESVKELANKAIHASNDKEYEKALELCAEIEKKEPEEEFEIINVLQIKAYQNILAIDIEGCKDEYNDDVERLFSFLDKIQLDEMMQYFVTEVIEVLCGKIESEWYAPRFKTFLEKIQEKNYLTAEEYITYLKSIHVITESVNFDDSKNVGRFVRELLRTRYQLIYMVKEDEYDSRNSQRIIDELRFRYYYAKHFNDYKENVQFVKENMPHNYELIKEIVEAVENDSEKVIADTVNEMKKYVKEGVSDEHLISSLDASYEFMMEQKEGITYVHGGKGTYKRPGNKIGRNDTCPCGSGKKYKNCCGR